MTRALLPDCLSCEVVPAIDAGNAALDHFAVVLTINWNATMRRPPKPRATWDRDKIRQAHEATWQAFFADWPDIPWTTDLTSHVHQVEGHLHERLTKFFPRATGVNRNSCLTEATLQAMQQKRYLKRVLTASKKICDHHQLQLALNSWRRDAPYRIGLSEALCVLRTTWRWTRYRYLTTQIRTMILQQRADWLDKQIEPLCHSDCKSALRILRPLRMGKRVKDQGKRPLQQVKLPEGRLASSPAEACARWRQHFADLEGGKLITTQALWDEAMQRLSDLPPPPGDVCEVPSLLEVERHLQHAAMGKALGCDLLPGELMKMAAPWMARAIWPIVLKTALWADEALQHKGGRLIVAYKGKGDHASCSQHRGLLVSSSLGKCIHNVWRARTQPYVFKGATSMQFTAQPHALVTQAAHCVRMFLHGQTSCGRSCYAMFLDIQAAYYRLLRQHSIHSDFSDSSLLQFLDRMGVTDLTIQDLADILQGRNALQDLDCPPHLQRVVSSLHASTWWKLDFDDSVVKTERGTRPGDGFADVIWQLCFSRYLHRVDDVLASLGVQCQLPWNHCPGFGSSPGDATLPLGTVVWADDAAFLGSTETADQAIPQLRIVAEVALTELLKMGMQPNMGCGKTEAILHLTGPGSRRVRQYVHHHCHSTIQLSVPGEDLALRIIPTYVHLGGVITRDASMRAEIKRKLALANSTLDNYKSKVLNNAKVPLAMRVQVFKATVAAVLNYNLGTWPTLTNAEHKLWISGVLRLYRRLLLRHYTSDEQFHMEDGRLLRLLQLPHPQVLLHVARLRQFAMCLKRQNCQFWAIAGLDVDWLQAVSAAAQWTFSQIQGLTCLPPPTTPDDLVQWQDYMTTAEKKFYGTLKRAQLHAMMQQDIHVDVRCFHKRILNILEKGGLQVAEEDPSSDMQPTMSLRLHRCLICQTDWPTYRTWAVHSFKCHQRASAFRQLQSGNKCDACGRIFSNHTRLTRHFRSVPSCAQTMAAQQRWTAPQPAMGSKAMMDALPYDSMIPYIDSTGPVLHARAGWAMTDATFRALRSFSTVDWTCVDDNALSELEGSLQALPLHHTEFEQVVEAQLNYYGGQEDACSQLQCFATRFRPYFGDPVEVAFVETKPEPDHLHDPSKLTFAAMTPPLRGHPRFHYILHLFAGAKRDGDLHSCLNSVPCEDGACFFPISLDVVLDPIQGDLLNDGVQAFWLEKTLQGLVYATVAGPPCETWSISRWRQLEGDAGPRPLRSTTNLFTLIWSLFPLRIRELRQTCVGNRLLHFSLLMMAAHCVTNTLGLLEHPAAPPARPAGIPPSIWRLPVVQLMRRHCNIMLTHLKQGYYGAKAPKPTTLMIVAPPSVRPAVLRAIHQGKTTDKLPPPLKMERTSKGFSTMPLKRYPVGLCQAIALALRSGIPSAPQLSYEVDGIYDIAERFQHAYEHTQHGEDGQDYCQQKIPV